MKPATTCYFCQPGVISQCWSQLMYQELLLILNRQTDERDQNHTYMHCNVYNLVPVMVSYINAVFMRVLAKLLWIGVISSLYIWQFWYAFFSLIISGNSTLCFIMSDTKMVIKNYKYYSNCIPVNCICYLVFKQCIQFEINILDYDFICFN